MFQVVLLHQTIVLVFNLNFKTPRVIPSGSQHPLFLVDYVWYYVIPSIPFRHTSIVFVN